MRGFFSFALLYLKSIILLLYKIFIGDLSSVSSTIDIKYVLQKKDNDFNYREYETQAKDYRTWLDWIFDLFGLPDFLSAILISALVYTIGLVVSYTIDFHGNYINTLAVYLMSFGIFLSILTIRFSSKGIHSSLSSLRPCFMVSDGEYRYFLDTWFKRLSNNRIILFITIATSIFLGMLLYYKLYDETTYNKLNLLSLELISFKVNGWYESVHLKVKFALFGFYILVISSILITCLRILFVNFFFLMDLLKLPVIPIPNLIKLRLGKLSRLYLITSFNWFIGVSLFGVMLFSIWDWLSVGVLSLISLVGFVTLFTPQYIYTRLLNRSQDLATNWIFSSFYGRMDISVNEKSLENIINSENASQLYRLKSLTDFFDASKPINPNIYNLPQLLFALAGQVFSFLSPKLLEWIKDIF